MLFLLLMFILSMLFAGFALAIYMLPTAIAFKHNIEDKYFILFINVLTGWTIFGWCFCMIYMGNIYKKQQLKIKTNKN